MLLLGSTIVHRSPTNWPSQGLDLEVDQPLFSSTSGLDPSSSPNPQQHAQITDLSHGP